MTLHPRFTKQYTQNDFERYLNRDEREFYMYLHRFHNRGGSMYAQNISYLAKRYELTFEEMIEYDLIDHGDWFVICKVLQEVIKAQRIDFTKQFKKYHLDIVRNGTVDKEIPGGERIFHSITQVFRTLF